MIYMLYAIYTIISSQCHSIYMYYTQEFDVSINETIYVENLLQFLYASASQLVIAYISDLQFIGIYM